MTRINEYQSTFLLWNVGFTFWPWACQYQIGYFRHSLLIHRQLRWTWNVPKTAPNGHRFSTAGWFPNGHGRRDISLGSPIYTQRGFPPRPTWVRSNICQISPNRVFPLSAPAECLDTAYLVHHLATSSFYAKYFIDNNCFLFDLYFWECSNHIWNVPCASLWLKRRLSCQNPMLLNNSLKLNIYRTFSITAEALRRDSLIPESQNLTPKNGPILITFEAFPAPPWQA